MSHTPSKPAWYFCPKLIENQKEFPPRKNLDGAWWSSRHNRFERWWDGARECWITRWSLDTVDPNDSGMELVRGGGPHDWTIGYMRQLATWKKGWRCSHVVRVSKHEDEGCRGGCSLLLEEERGWSGERSNFWWRVGRGKKFILSYFLITQPLL